MRKIFAVFIGMFVLASSVVVITIGKNVNVEIENEDCGCENDIIYTTIRPDGTECKCLLLNGKYPVMSELPPRTEEELRLMDLNPQPTMDPNDLPDSFSWLSFGGNWLTPAKNQGNCGSCWAFGALGAMESAIKIASADSGWNPDLSEQYILSCLSAAGSCGGGWMSTCLQYIKSTSPGSTGNGINGCTIETCMPYQAVDWIPCSEKCDEWDQFTYPYPEKDDHLFQILDTGYFSTDPNDQNDWDLLKTYVFEYGPIVVDIYASGGWSSFWNTHHSPTDVYDGSEQGTTNHAQVLCGWVNDQNVKNGGYWIIKNSWGTGFGYNGFSNIAYGCLRLGDRDVSWVTTTEWDIEEEEEVPDPTVPVIKLVYAGWDYYVGNDQGDQCPRPGEEMRFRDQSTGPVVDWQWDFNGDGIIDSTSNRPTWSYASPGQYSVTLIVSNEWGVNSTLAKTVIVKDIWPPKAVISPDYYAGRKTKIDFEGRFSYNPDPDESIVNYAWNFGDGTIVEDDTTGHLSHTYPDQNDEYTATLTVTNTKGATDTAISEIKIDKYQPPITTAYPGGIGTDDDNWFNNDPTKLDLVATDWTGVSKLRYRMDSTQPEEWKTVPAYGSREFLEELKISGHGVHYIEFFSEDVYGVVESVKDVQIKIDTKLPALDIDVNGNTVTLTGTDADSGVKIINYNIDYNDWEEYTGPFTINQGGTHTLLVVVEDIAGNSYSEQKQITTMPGPSLPEINGPQSGKSQTLYTFYFASTDSQGSDISYYVDWGDGTTTGWTEYVPSGQAITKDHSWTGEGSFTVKAKAKNRNGIESDWSETHEIRLPKSKISNPFLSNLFERTVNIFQIIEWIINTMFY